MAGANSQLTSGGKTVASGDGQPGGRDPRVLAGLVFVAFGIVYMIVNAASLIDERQALGQPIEAWRAWMLEATSLLAWIILLPVILGVARRLANLSRLSLILASHAAACLAMSLAHTAIMLSLRILVSAVVSEKYRPAGAILDLLVFEFRKDIITYVSILLIFLIAGRLVVAPAPPAEHQAELDVLIDVRDGSRTIWLKPDEIDLVTAAGNYVELHGAFGTELSRRTMSDIEEALAPFGFVRVHRSRLVRKASIASIETKQSGDFDILLRSGTSIGGSRRFRANLQL